LEGVKVLKRPARKPSKTLKICPWERFNCKTIKRLGKQQSGMVEEKKRFRK